MIKKIIRCFLPVSNINKIGLYMANIKIYLYYLIFYIEQKYFNVPKSARCIKKLVVSQVIILNKNVMIQKRSLIIIILNIRYGQVINRIYNAGLLSIKVLIIIKA